MAKKFSFDKLTGDSKKEVKKKEEEPKKEYKMLRIKFETHHQSLEDKKHLRFCSGY